MVFCHCEILANAAADMGLKGAAQNNENSERLPVLSRVTYSIINKNFLWHAGNQQAMSPYLQ